MTFNDTIDREKAETDSPADWALPYKKYRGEVNKC